MRCHFLKVLRGAFVFLMLAHGPVIGAPATTDAPGRSWAGFYVGGSVAGRWAENKWTSTNIFPLFGDVVQPVAGGSMDNVAARIAGYLGYNWQIAPAWIVGIEGDLGWANNVKTSTPAPGTAGISSAGGCGGACTGQPTATVRENWDGSFRGRIGALITPNTLLFVTTGVEWQQVKLAASCAFDGLGSSFCVANEHGEASRTLTGWTLGAGMEQKILTNWIARLDYRFAEFGTFSHQFFSVFPALPADDRFTGNLQLKTHTVELGLAYEF